MPCPRSSCQIPDRQLKTVYVALGIGAAVALGYSLYTCYKGKCCGRACKCPAGKCCCVIAGGDCGCKSGGVCKCTPGQCTCSAKAASSSDCGCKEGATCKCAPGECKCVKAGDKKASCCA